VAVPRIEPIADSWYQRKARELQRVAASAVMSGLGQDAPPPKAPNTGMMFGWLALTAVAAGLFWAVTSGPIGGPVRANRRRRSSRRRVSRNTKRRSSRGNRAESRLARKESREEQAHLRSTIGAAGLIGEWHHLQDEEMALVLEKVRLLKAGKSPVAIQKRIDAVKAKIRKIEQSTGYYNHDEAERRRAAHSERKPSVRAVRGPDGKVRLVRRNSRRRSSRRRVSRNAVDVARHDVFDPARERARLREMLKQARYNVGAYQRDVERGGAGVVGWKRELVYWKGQAADIKRKLDSLHGVRRNSHKSRRAITRRRTTKRRTTGIRRLAANARKSSAYAQAQTALSTIRNLGVNGTPSAAKLSKSVQDKLVRRGMGLYRVGGSGRSPKITAFKSSTSLQGAMTNTRIATTASGEPHWLVKVYKGGRPKVVVVRYIGKDGKTRFRAEEYARAMFKVAQEYARRLGSRRVG
jgi:hypothetical protein